MGVCVTLRDPEQRLRGHDNRAGSVTFNIDTVEAGRAVLTLPSPEQEVQGRPGEAE